MFARKHFHASRMIGVLVRNKNSPHFFQGQSEPFHPPLGFTARYPGINKHGITLIADIIAVAVTARIKGGNVERHDPAKKIKNSLRK